MTRTRSSFRWTKSFFLRLLASYIVIPLVPGSLLALGTRGAGGYWLAFVYIYGIFGLAAMVVLGTPLLFVYLRLGWTGFVPFMAAGGACAGITAFALGPPRGGTQGVIFFAITGLIAGLFFRVTLFGFRRQPALGDASEEGPAGI
jgi:hypothetical protein